MADPAEIARRLSKEQKRALLWLPADGSERQCSELDRSNPSKGRFSELRTLGLEQRRQAAGGPMRRITPLGTQVRAIVEQGGGA